MRKIKADASWISSRPVEDAYNVMPQYNPTETNSRDGREYNAGVRTSNIDELDGILAHLSYKSPTVLYEAETYEVGMCEGVSEEKSKSMSLSANTFSSDSIPVTSGSLANSSGASFTTPASRATPPIIQPTLPIPIAVNLQPSVTTQEPVQNGAWMAKQDKDNPGTWIVQRQRNDRPGTIHQFHVLPVKAKEKAGSVIPTVPQLEKAKSVPIANVEDSNNSIQSLPLTSSSDMFVDVFPIYTEQLRGTLSRCKGNLCKTGWRCWETSTPCGGSFVEVTNSSGVSSSTSDGKKGSGRDKRQITTKTTPKESEMKFEHRDPILLSEENVGQFLLCISFLNKCVPSTIAITSDSFLRSLDVYVSSGLKRHPFGNSSCEDIVDKYSEQYLQNNLDEKISRGVFIAAAVYLHNAKVEDLLTYTSGPAVPLYLGMPDLDSPGGSNGSNGAKLIISNPI